MTKKEASALSTSSAVTEAAETAEPLSVAGNTEHVEGKVYTFDKDNAYKFYSDEEVVSSSAAQTYDEYLVFKNAGLQSRMINGQLALVRSDINLSRVDEYGRTNLERMLSGKAPLDSTGKPFELHHIGQKNNGSLAILDGVYMRSSQTASQTASQIAMHLM